MKNLPIKNLDFEGLKNAFKDFLKGDQNYKDFNFEASGISSLLNILAYNSHLNGFYAKMLLDESFIDSAHTREALLSHAKRSGYIPRGKRSSRADVILSILVDVMPPSMSLRVARGSTFTSTNSNADRRNFFNADDVVLQKYTHVTENGVPKIKFTSEPFTVYEGSREFYRFTVDAEDISQRYVIRDRDIDIDTLRVNVFNSLGSTVKTEFKRAEDIFELTSDSNVYFITTNEDGYFQVFFGDGVFGSKLENGNIVETTYISTNGESGNGARVFQFSPSEGNFEDHETETVSISSGGMEEETVESLRFTIPHHYRRQNRIVTESDYRAVLLSEFRNIDSINVWGGESNSRREYGKVFVSIKPRGADALTSSARNEIKRAVIEKYGVVGVEVMFVDPDFINVDVTVKAKIDYRKTNRTKGQIESLIIERTQEFNDDNLNKFGNILSDVAMLDFIREGESAFISCYSTKTLRKSYKLLHRSTATHEIVFGNELNKGISSTSIVYGGEICQFRDENGLLYLVRVSDGTKFLPKSFGTVDYTTGKIEFTLPSTARAVGYESENIGVIEFSATPVSPDIETNLNNIVRIQSVRAIVS